MTDDKNPNPSYDKFFELHETSIDVVKLYQKKFLCIDEEESTLHGDYDSLAARTIRVQLRKCEGKDYCKSDEEIT